MTNFQTAVDATTTASNSSGSAMRENAKYMDSIAGKTQLLKAEIEKLILGDGGLQNLAKTLLDVGTVILKLVNNDFVQLLAKLALLYASLNLVYSSTNKINVATIGTMVRKIIDVLVPLIGAIFGVEGAVNSLNASLKLLEIDPIILAITAIIGVIGGTVLIAKKLEERTEKLSEKTKELKDSYSEGKSTLESYTKELENVNAELERYSKLKQEDLSAQDKAQIRDLKIQQAELEQTIRLQKIANEEAYKKYAKKAKKSVEAEDTYQLDGGGRTYYENMDRTEYIDYAIEKMEKYNDSIDKASVRIDELNKKKEKNGSLSSSEQSELNKLNQEVSNSAEAYEELYSKSAKYSNELREETEGLKEGNKTKKKATDAIDKFSEWTGKATENTKKLTNTNYDLSTTEEEVATSFQIVSENVKSLQSNYDALSAIVQDYNDDGIMSISNLESLLSLGSNYLQYLEIQNGKLVLNEDAMQRMAEAQINEAESKVYNEAMTRLDTIAKNENAKATENSANASYTAGNASLENAQKALASADAWDKYWSSVENKKNINTESQKKQSEEVKNNLYTQLKMLESAKKGFGSYSKSTDKSTGANKKNTSSIDENTKALKAQADALKTVKEQLDDQVKNYEKAISYINSKIDDEIDKIEDLKDKEIDSIKTQIDTLKEQRDAEEDYWDAKIDALNEQNDALEDQIEYEKLLEELEKAKSQKVKVYREGQGYVYETDQSAVSEAKQNIIEFNRKKQQEQELKELEELKEAKLKNYDKQIEDLENYQKKVEDNYNIQIQYYKNWKDQFKKQVDSYETEQNRLLVLQLTGIDFEQQGWQLRLNNLNGFVSSYIAKLQELQRATDEYNKAQQAYSLAQSQSSSSGGGGSSYKPSSSVSKDLTLDEINYLINGAIANLGKNKSTAGINNEIEKVYKQGKITTSQRKQLLDTVKWYTTQDPNWYKHYASGVAQVKDDEIAITGENPNKEIVLGSKANGVLTSIPKGGGVVNAKSTKTLAGLLNQLGGMNIGNSYPLTNNSNSTSISIGNISLPQVKNGSDFVDYLQNFRLDMTQKSFS